MGIAGIRINWDFDSGTHSQLVESKTSLNYIRICDQIRCGTGILQESLKIPFHTFIVCENLLKALKKRKIAYE